MRNHIMKISTSVFLAAVLLFALGISGALAAPVSGIDVTYTSDADFDKGNLMNLNHETSHDQLQLSDAITPFPFINIANSVRGTIVRIDVNTGMILGEYYTSPNYMGKDPSRTTVDQFGNVWVSNRAEYSKTPDGKSKGSITRVGLIIGGTRASADGTLNPSGQYLKPPFQYNTCTDRNNDGLIKTSRGADNILIWTNTNRADSNGGVSTADDECIINYTRVIATGTRTVAIDANNDVWVGGDNTAHEKVSGVTGQPVPGTQFNLGCGGYGGLIDKNGVLWSSRYGSGLLRYDTNTMTGACLGNGRGDYGLALDPNTGEIWHTFLERNKVAKLAPDGTLMAIYSHGEYYAQGIVVDKSGNVWVAHSLLGGSSTVGHLRTNGAFVGNISVGSGPTGVAVDANGKVWSTNYNSWTASRIDPNAGAVGGGGFKKGAVDKTVNLGYRAYPYNYSDMTGYVAIGGTSAQGSWTVIQDSGAAGNEWGTITWNRESQGSTPDGAIILVEARAADTEAGLSSKTFIAVSNNKPFVMTGRYIEARATLKPNSSGEKPVLSDLRISITPISDVRVIDTISSANIVINAGSFTREPYSISYGSDTAVIEWRFDSFTIGQTDDLSYSVTMKDPVPGENRLVDHKVEVLYTDINGKPVKYETGPQYVQVLSSKYASALTTDKQSYSAKENVLINAAINNLSQFARTIDAKITIEDTSEAAVQEVSSLSGLQFASGETKNFNNLTFNTGSNSAGNYRARLVLYEGQNQVGTVSADFKIVPDIAINSSITSDKISYKANEQVVMTSTVQNASANSIIENMTSRISIKNSHGTTLQTESKPILLLTPSQRVNFNTSWNIATNPAGTYSANLEVFSGDTVLSASSAQFEILSTAVTGGGFSGTIAASPSWVYQGKPETFEAAVTNNGNEDVTGLTARILVVDPDTGQTRLTFVNEAVAVGRGATMTDNRTASTTDLTPKFYLAILQVQTAAMAEPKTLASIAFEVRDSVPPVTTIIVGEPRFETAGRLYVANSTTFSLSASDDFSGVAKTEYQVDSGLWTAYTTTFTLVTYGSGTHTMQYRSTDNAQNQETASQITVVLDKESPEAVISASDPLIEGVINTVSPSTFFTLSATDALSGVRSIAYRVDGGTWQMYTGSFNLAGMNAGQHTIGYKATDNVLNEEIEKILTVRLIVLDENKKISADANVLIAAWAHHHKDEKKENNEDDERHDEKHRERESAIHTLTDILGEAGIAYHVPHDKDDFVSSFRSGRYNTYILLHKEDHDEEDHIEDLEEEIREAVHYGHGLINLNGRSDDDHEFEDVLGVKFHGRTGKHVTVNLNNSPISNEGMLETAGSALVTSITATSAAAYAEFTGKKGESHPAIVYNEYGKGRAMLFAFDLLSAPDRAVAAALLINSISHVRPAEQAPLALASIPVRIKLDNSLEPIDVRIKEYLPDSTTADSIRPDAPVKNGVITWDKAVAAGEKAVFGYYLNLPDLAGSYRTRTEVYYSNLGDYRLFGSYSLTLNVQADSGEILRSAISGLEALLTGLPDQSKHKKDEEDDDHESCDDDDEHSSYHVEHIVHAIKELNRIDAFASSRKAAEKNIERIRRAIEEVRKPALDVTDIRLNLDELLRVWEKKWYLIESSHHGNHDRDG